MSSTTLDSAAEKLLGRDSGDSEIFTAPKDLETQRALRRNGTWRRGLLLQSSCTMGALFVTTLAAYLCGVRLVFAGAGSSGQVFPSDISKCKAHIANIIWAYMVS